jgi:hypothetical protein
MNLAYAIDIAVNFVRTHPDLMTRAELTEFEAIAEAVYLLAVTAGLVHVLPQVPELKPELMPNGNLIDMPTIQFRSKLNLPGDFDSLLPSTWKLVGADPPEATERAFLVCATPRWFTDMAALRKAAEEQGRSVRAGNPVEALLGDEGKKVLAIAQAKGISSNKKMEKISDIDQRFLEFDSVWWANLLNVSEGRIRQNRCWMNSQRKAK